MIVGINVIGGIIIAVAQKGMSFVDATQTFTLLTVGDGLVSQMPALIVSTAAGLMVSKAGVEGSTDKALMSQLSFYPQALGMAAAVMGIVAVLPGMPTFVFAGLSARHRHVLAYLAYKRKDAARSRRLARGRKGEGRRGAEGRTDRDRARARSSARRTRLRPAAAHQRRARATASPTRSRRCAASWRSEMGFVMPSVRILDNMQLGANEYRIRVKEVDSGRGELFPGSLLVMDPQGRADRPARHAHDRAGLRPARDLDRRARCARKPAFRGYTVVDPGTVLTTHLTEVLKANMSRAALLRRNQEAARRSAGRNRRSWSRNSSPRRSPSPACSACCRRCSASASPSATCRPSSKASPKPSATPRTRSTSPSMCAPASRARSATPIFRRAAICRSSRCRPPGSRRSRNRSSARAKTASSPWRRRSFSNSSRPCATRFDEAGQNGDVPVLLTSPQVRPFVRSIIERFRAQTVVMSQNEIHACVRLAHAGSGMTRHAAAHLHRQGHARGARPMCAPRWDERHHRRQRKAKTAASWCARRWMEAGSSAGAAPRGAGRSLLSRRFRRPLSRRPDRRLRIAPSDAAGAGRAFDRAELLARLHRHRPPDALAHALAEDGEQGAISPT